MGIEQSTITAPLSANNATRTAEVTEEALHQAYADAKEKYGALSDDSMAAAFALDDFYVNSEELGSCKRRVVLLTELLKVVETVGGSHHPTAVDIVRAQASIAFTSEQFNECERLDRRSVEGYGKHDPDGVSLRNALVRLAEVLAVNGKLDEAAEVLHRAAARGIDEECADRLYQIYQSRLHLQDFSHTAPGARETRSYKIHQDTVSIASLLIHAPIELSAGLLRLLGTLRFAAFDKVSAATAFRWSWMVSDSPLLCTGCQCEIAALPWFPCTLCANKVDLCLNCHQELLRGDLRLDCKSHDLWLLEIPAAPTDDPDLYVRWLRDVAKSAEEDARKCADRINDIYRDRSQINESVNFATIAVQPTEEKQAVPDLPLDEDLIRVQRCRQFQIRAQIPLRIRNAFEIQGNLPSELPDWEVSYSENDSDAFKAACSMIEAYVRLAEQPITSPVPNRPNQAGSGSDSLTQRPHSVRGALYARIPLQNTPSCTRVLELLQGDSNTAIECRLRTVDIRSETGSYEALSYVWGKAPPGDADVVKIGGQCLNITPNLRDALLALRYKDRPRSLWVDALCINQEDDDEKAHQIALMGEIYKAAKVVVVFLGADGTPFTSLFNFFGREPRTHDESFDRTVQRLGVTIPELVEALTQFCSFEWWTRTWIMQEYALASTPPQIRVGQIFVSTETMHDDTLKLVNEAGRPHGIYSERIHDLHKLANLTSQALAVLRSRRFGSGRVQLNFFQVFLSTQQLSRCTDARDIVFGRWVFLEPTLRRLFRPSHPLITLDKMFEKLAIWLLVFERWDAMFWVCPVRMSKQLPSWVPDFTVPRQQLVLGDIPFPKASESSANTAIILRGALALRGHFLDVVDAVFELDDPSWLHQACNLWHLDNYFARQEVESGLYGRPPSFSKELLQLFRAHTSTSIREWCTTFETGEFSMASTLQPSVDFMASVAEAVQSLNGLLRLRIGEPEVDGAISFPGLMADLRIRMMLAKNITKLYQEIGNISSEDLHGAALFDYENLIARIRHLSKPPLALWEKDECAPVQSVIDRLALPSVPESVPEGCKPTAPVLGLPSPSYADLQRLITAATTEAEVRLRVTLVARLAWSIRSTEGLVRHPPSAPVETCHPQHQREEDTVGSSVEQGRRNDGLLNPDLQSQARVLSMRMSRWYADLFRHRTFFVTKHRIVGVGVTGVTDIRPGDELLIQEIPSLPLIARPTGKANTSGDVYRTIVGHANVRGLKNGEFHELEMYQRPPPQWFKFK